MDVSNRGQAIVGVWSVVWGLTLAWSFSPVAQAEDAVSPLRVIGGTTPVIELFQNTSGGFPQQQWDFFGDEVGFGIENFTRITVPFYIEAAAPEDSFFIKANGSVGLGTNLPDWIGNKSIVSVGGAGRQLNLNSATGVGRSIVRGKTGAEMFLVHADSPVNAKIARARVFAGRYIISAIKDDLTPGSELYALCVNLATGNVGVKCLSPTKPFQVGGDGPGSDGNGAHVTLGGVWTNASSRAVKNDIQPITSEQARETVRALQPVGYRYKNEPDEKYVGFIAEDVPDLVATGDRKSLASMDIVAVLTKVVQDQQVEMRDQNALLKQQQKLLDEQRQALQTQQTLLTTLTRRLADIEKNVGAATSE